MNGRDTTSKTVALFCESCGALAYRSEKLLRDVNERDQANADFSGMYFDRIVYDPYFHLSLLTLITVCSRFLQENVLSGWIETKAVYIYSCI